jgi:hypothetical protein
MTWLFHHRASEQAAAEAHEARGRGQDELAKSLFANAAASETLALLQLSVEEKPRTFGITAVSAVALLYKGTQLEEAEKLAHSLLSKSGLPDFAADQLRELLQSIWNERVQAAAGIRFVPGQITLSVDGGEVVRGGAPLDLVVERVQTVQSIFYRTAEFLKHLPLRRRGPATRQIQDSCRPWLFQSVPGSYQFTIAIQGPLQPDLFDSGEPEPRLVASTFMAILEGAATDPEQALPAVVQDKDYRSTFLKLARNLAPTGRVFTRLEIRSSQGKAPVVLTQESRKAMTRTIRGAEPERRTGEQAEEITLRGVLRAVHLEKDWLELVVDDSLLHIAGVGETVDDVIGPMVNHLVAVQATRDNKGSFAFRDIELDDDSTGTEANVKRDG